MKDQDYFIELLMKEADGFLSDSERKELNDWLQSSSRHKDIAKHVKATLSLAENPIETVKVDLNKEYDEVKLKINREATRRSIHKWSIAASILILIGLISVFYFLNTPDKGNTIVYTGPNDELILRDGSTVWLEANARIEVSITKDSRTVTFFGKGFFNIIPDSDRPFIVQTNHGTITVLGTSFEVVTDDNQTFVNLESGKLSVVNNIDQNVTLDPGESSVLTTSNIVKKKSILPAGAWRLQPILYQQAPLQTIIREIEEKYKISFESESTTVLDCEINFNLDYPPISDLIKILETLLDIKIDNEGDVQYIIHGAGC